MLRIIGACLIIVSCSALGFMKAMEYKKRINMLEELKRMFMHLRGEISFAKNPFMEAFENMTEKEHGIMGELCELMSIQLKLADGKTFYEKWCMCIDEVLKGTAFDTQDITDLKKVGKRLGYLDYNMQLSTIDLEIEHLDEIISYLNTDIQPKQKVCKCVGVFMGLMITIILL